MEYTKPELEIVLLDGLRDIVTTSGLKNGGSGGSDGGNWNDFI